MSDESVLVNFVYCHPVGHAVEALQYCLGYRRADPQRRIGLVLKANTAVDLAHWTEHVDEVYTVDFDVFTPPAHGVAAHIPRDWDWVIDDPRGHQTWQHELFPGLREYYRQSSEHFRARNAHTVIGAPQPAYQPGNRLHLNPSADAHDWARHQLPEIDEPTIAVLPGGSAQRWRYPTTTAWRRILRTLTDRWPHARICLLGKHTEDGRSTTGFSTAEYDALAAEAPSTTWAVDVGLDRQLAALQRCDLLLSPHTGFGFAAMAAGTPWLVLAGNDWAEYYFNPGVPFYSVLPDIDRYPCYLMLGNQPDPVDDEGPRAPSMCADRITEDLPELLRGAEWLCSGHADFDTAMRHHVTRAAELFGHRHELMFSVDDLHVPYLP
ncbi:MAG: hypothetical protein IJH84_14660 [Saccharopolyspora sp.]|uniref:glycosyltransferase family 9 protein n=1 Tax=Saccharopolyspora sp. TaxID=33915 RepID=UPI00260003D3|nr:hypothetical protein [Saccharopolyspora sp.]MBQ6642255.1 hypothetical protein [Saccharopolyspora sp.]